MTAALYHLSPGTLAEAGPGLVVELAGNEGHHAVTVKRTTVGEEILLADGGAQVATCEVVTVGDGTLRARVTALGPGTYPGPRIVLVQALAKNERDLQAIEAATELGVDEVVPWQAERSIVQWKGDRGTKALRKWTNQVQAAAKQSRRPTVPVVSEIVRTAGLLARAQSAALAVVLHEDAEKSIAAVNLPTDGEVVLVVGPEGGISPHEIDALQAAGAVPVRMGRYVLRSSSAGPAAIAALSAGYRWA